MNSQFQSRTSSVTKRVSSLLKLSSCVLPVYHSWDHAARSLTFPSSYAIVRVDREGESQMTKMETETAEGVRDAWDFWLSQHPITVQDILEVAIEKAVKNWLDAHEDEILAVLTTTQMAAHN